MKVYLAESNPRIRNGLGARLRAIPADVGEHEGVGALIAHWHADDTPAELRDDTVALIAVSTATPTELADLQRLRTAGLTRLEGPVLRDNRRMLRFARAGLHEQRGARGTHHRAHRPAARGMTGGAAEHARTASPRQP